MIFAIQPHYAVQVMGSGRRHRRRSRRKAVADCREGRHTYGPPQDIGGGITRQTCSVCGTVTIDITEPEPEPAPGPFGFKKRRGNDG